MLDSIFCMAPEGLHPNSNRPFEAMMAGCIPVIIADQFELPFENFLDWRAFSIKLPEAQVSSAIHTLRSMSQVNVLL